MIGAAGESSPALAKVGLAERAGQAAIAAETAAPSITDADEHAKALTGAAWAQAGAGPASQAEQVATAAEAAARSASHPEYQAEALHSQP